MHSWALGLVLALAVSAPATEPWIAEPAYGNLHVVAPDPANAANQLAADEFVRLWEACTGARPTQSTTERFKVVNVWIGAADSRFAGELNTADLGPDGFEIKTLAMDESARSARRDGRLPIWSRHLLIAGGGPRGTLYGVYQFFHDVMGVRWLTAQVTHYPAPPAAIEPLKFRYTPDIPYRDTNFWMFTQNPAFALVHHLNGHMQQLPPEMGGHLGYAGSFAHTFYELVSPDSYYDTHPEYFSLVDGKRLRKSQLCLSNPDVLAIATDSVRARLTDYQKRVDAGEAPPLAHPIVSVTQNDWPFWCTCDRCAAIDAEEGSHAGTLLRFVNAIADNIKPDFPDAYIDTFAYTYTRKAPRLVKARDNVIVRLCSIECDFSRPLDDPDSAVNRAFAEDITAWQAVAPHLYIWDYTQNWHAFQGPHPNMHVLQPNVRFFRDHGVEGVFEQAAHSPRSDFDDLKAYLVANALWNPDGDGQACYDEFVDLYYGPAAPFIREYHALITGKVHDDHYDLGIFSHMEWMDAATVTAAEAIFARAFAVVTEGEYLERLRWAYLPVQYAALTCPPDVEITDTSYVLTRPPSLSFDAYWALLQRYGVTHLEDRPIEAFKTRLQGETPPRHQEFAIEKLENAQYLVWVVPELGGAIVRFQDKRMNLDLLAGHADIRTRRGWYQDWTRSDPAAPVKETPLAPAYTVSRRTADSITLQAPLSGGGVIERTMRLPADARQLDVDTTLRNTGTEAISPHVKVHPEFALPANAEPSIWAERDGTWQAVALSWDEARAVAAGDVPMAGTTRWAYSLPDPGISVINAFDPALLDGLSYSVDRPGGHLNLELLLSAAPLAPGATRSLHCTYEVRAASMETQAPSVPLIPATPEDVPEP